MKSELINDGLYFVEAEVSLSELLEHDTEEDYDEEEEEYIM